MAGEHITLKKNDDFILIEIDDYELFDFVDDYLVENDLSYDYMQEDEEKNTFTMLFNLGTDYPRLKSLIDALSKAEIERIYRLNN